MQQFPNKKLKMGTLSDHWAIELFWFNHNSRKRVVTPKPTRHHQKKQSDTSTSLPSDQKKPWKKIQVATEPQNETSFSGRPFRRKSCMQFHLNFWMQLGMVSTNFLEFLPNVPLVDKPVNVGKLTSISAKNTSLSTCVCIKCNWVLALQTWQPFLLA